MVHKDPPCSDPCSRDRASSTQPHLLLERVQDAVHQQLLQPRVNVARTQRRHHLRGIKAWMARIEQVGTHTSQQATAHPPPESPCRQHMQGNELFQAANPPPMHQAAPTFSMVSMTMRLYGSLSSFRSSTTRPTISEHPTCGAHRHIAGHERHEAKRCTHRRTPSHSGHLRHLVVWQGA